jgi:glutathione synthase/RimK-type ligase-like ATP-grasp enzyme
LKTVYLVSSLDLIHADEENIYLETALKKRGFNSKIVCWDDTTIEWNKADLVISRMTGTYFKDPQRFLKWAGKVDKTTKLWNPYPIIEWNIHKSYLIELQKKGIPIPETILIPQNTEQSFESILEMIPWDDFIVKPCIAAGSGGLRRFTKDSPDFETHLWNLNKHGFVQVFIFGNLEFIPSDTLIQQFIPEIKENGESSLIFFGSKYSHSMIKKAKVDDFRAHPIWGATIERYNPTESEIDICLEILNMLEHPIEYARFDMIPIEEQPLIIEVELIDPNLFFDQLPETVESFANHIELYLNR